LTTDPNPERRDSSDWTTGRIADLSARLTKTSRPADRGVLWREVLRTVGGECHLDGGPLSDAVVPTLDEVDLQRFGLERSAGVVRLTGRMPREVPKALADALAACLAIDPARRRREPTAAADGALLRLTDHPCYRNPSQKAAMRALLTMPAGATLLTTLATGSGKSLLFQAGIQWLQELQGSTDEVATGIVLVPTVSLALDHIESIRHEVSPLSGCAAMVAGMTDREAALLGFVQGSAPLLFMAPEMLLGKDRSRFLDTASPRADRPLAAKGRLAAVFIDEAHIIESWGRSFRPDYQRLPAVIDELRSRNPGLRVVLLSATIDKTALELLKRQYGRGEFLQVSEGAPRVEFDLAAHRFGAKEERDEVLERLLDHLPRPAIVYTTRVEAAVDLEARLRRRGYERLASFTGDTGAARRETVVKEWRSGELDLVVATSAFGMGVNHPGVRAVVHACVPESASRYYQEVGRAGRDGHQALSLVMAAPEDESDSVSLALGTVLTQEVAAERWEALVSAGRPLTSRDGRSRFRIDLRAAARRHPRPGLLNMRWNKALLVQLQRYGALEVEELDESKDMWGVAFASDWVRLLDRSPVPERALEELFQLRDKEQGSYRSAVEMFRSVLFPRGVDVPCQWADLFRMVDAARPWCDPCGRCPACRMAARPPSQTPTPGGIRYGGTAAVWTKSERLRRSPEVIFVPNSKEPDLGALCRGLGDSGIEQWVVPDQFAVSVAGELRKQEGNPGLVLTWSDVLDGDWSPADRPSVALYGPFSLRQNLVTVFRHIDGMVRGGDLDLRAWVCSASDMVGDRRLSDIATSSAPLSLEDALREGLECR